MLRAVGRFLHGESFSYLGTRSLAAHLAVPFADLLPRPLRRLLYSWGGWFEAVPPSRLHELTAGAMSAWMVDHYPRRQYPAAMIGASNGAAVHLCCALGIPWLPQTLLVPVRRSQRDVDDFQASMHSLDGPAGRFLDRNPELQLHHMHDPNQDRLMVRHMAYLRVKRRQLDSTLIEFLEDVVAPGGTLFLLDCRLTWPTTQVAERHFFQAGAWGGVDPDEYLRGSRRVEEFLHQHGALQKTWNAPSDGRQSEAEWGFERCLADDVYALAEKHGWRVRRIGFHDPQDLSPLVAELHRWWCRQRGIDASRLLVESFIVMDPWWTLRTGSVPFWTVFPVEAAFRALEDYLQQSGPFNEMDLMLFSHGVRSIGIAPLDDWRKILARARQRGRFIGVNERAFPQDFAVFARYERAIRRHIGQRFPMPEPLTLHQFDDFLRQHDVGSRIELSDWG